MSDAKELRDDFVSHLMSIDKSRLNMCDLRIYCDMVEAVTRMSRPDVSDSLQAIMAGMNSCQCERKEFHE